MICVIDFIIESLENVVLQRPYKVTWGSQQAPKIHYNAITLHVCSLCHCVRALAPCEFKSSEQWIVCSKPHWLCSGLSLT